MLTCINKNSLPTKMYKSYPDKVFDFAYTALISDLENPGKERTEFPCPCCHGRAWIDKPLGGSKFHAECPDCGMKLEETHE